MNGGGPTDSNHMKTTCGAHKLCKTPTRSTHGSVSRNFWSCKHRGLGCTPWAHLTLTFPDKKKLLDGGSGQ